MVLLHLMPRSAAACYKALPTIPGRTSSTSLSTMSCPLLLTGRTYHPSRRRTLYTAAGPDTALGELQNAVSPTSQSEQAKGETPAASPAPAAAELDMSALDLRVGRILQVEDHPEADKLYVETIDVGEEEPRTIASGLRDFVARDALKDRLVIVLCNLKPRKMRGVASNGMLLCASNEAHDHVETLSPPFDAQPGERIFFGDGGAVQSEPLSSNQLQKKKAFETLQPDLHTSTSGMAMWKDKAMLTRHGPVKAPTLTHARIS